MSAAGQESHSGLAHPPVREVALARPFAWIALGWRDFVRCPGPSLLHGLAFAGGGVLVVAIFSGRFFVAAGAFTGFVLIAPILATGLYEVSRQLERGVQPGFADVFAAWRRGTRPLVWMGLTLMVIGTFWVLLSAVLIALLVSAPITGMESFLRHVVLSQDSNLFLVWVLLGGVLAALVFAGTVVSAPLLLDRDVDFASAVLTSARAVAESPLAMVVWASLILLATAIGMATFLAGLVVAIPVVGHASWHAYRDVVDASALPPRA